MLENVSIVIPVATNDLTYKDLIKSIKETSFKGEIICVGPDFENVKKENEQIFFYHSPLGRAKQQNLGAIKSTKKYIWFLHADSNIFLIDLKDVETQINKSPDQIGFFNLKFETKNTFLVNLMKLNEIGVHFRSHVLKMPFGDQGFILTKKVFYDLGLFPEDAPYGEDHLLIWRAHQKRIGLNFLGYPLLTSDRKYVNKGWLKTTLSHLFYTYLQAIPEWLKTFQSPQKKIAVAIFVKTPTLSKVKTRLAKDIGEESALAFFWESLKQTEQVAINVLKTKFYEVDFYWAIAEKEGMDFTYWQNFNRLCQNEGSLGERIHHIYHQLKKTYHGVILIGADCPVMHETHLLMAIESLKEKSEFILGPSDDGGFYLFGGNKFIEKDIWTSVEYSTDQTMNDLIKRLNAPEINYLEKLFDIDEIKDLIRYQNLKS